MGKNRANKRKSQSNEEDMGKNRANKRKSQSNKKETQKKIKLDEGNQQKTPDSIKQKKSKQQNKSPKNVTPKGGDKVDNVVIKGNKQKNNTPNNSKKNKRNDNLKKFSGTANIEEKEKHVNSSGDESDYEVELEIKPEKITKTMNEDNQDSDEAKISKSDDSDDDDDDDDDEEDKDTAQEDVDNAVNENSENDEKKSKKDKKKKASTNEKQPQVDNTEKLKAFVDNEVVTNKRKMRYVLFIGNLGYDTTIDDMKDHFKTGIDIKHIRIPKGKDKKSRGFGYLEVSDNASYLNAMAMHHSFLKGRRINVLYSTGGKKNSEHAKSVIKKKNFKLNALRKSGKLEGSKKHSNKRSVRRAKKRAFDAKTE